MAFSDFCFFFHSSFSMTALFRLSDNPLYFSLRFSISRPSEVLLFFEAATKDIRTITDIKTVITLSKNNPYSKKISNIFGLYFSFSLYRI